MTKTAPRRARQLASVMSEYSAFLETGAPNSRKTFFPEPQRVELRFAFLLRTTDIRGIKMSFLLLSGTPPAVRGRPTPPPGLPPCSPQQSVLHLRKSQFRLVTATAPVVLLTVDFAAETPFIHL
ncbi:hypothetical protein J6590_021579 [Homalodisca vitripennis]|nr:hypothetical protein J6590_021579 [Homalodisca vitripennis]